MRLALLLCTLAALGSDSLRAQSTSRVSPRWEAGLSTLVGIAPLIGGTVGVHVPTRTPLRLAVELSGYGPLVSQRAWGCLQSVGGCVNGEPMPQARALASLGLRASVPLSARWYAVANGAVVHGQWQYPVRGSAVRAASGLGIGRNSRGGTHSLELRWQRFGTTGAPADAWRLGWSRRW